MSCCDTGCCGGDTNAPATAVNVMGTQGESTTAGLDVLECLDGPVEDKVRACLERGGVVVFSATFESRMTPTLTTHVQALVRNGEAMGYEFVDVEEDLALCEAFEIDEQLPTVMVRDGALLRLHRGVTMSYFEDVIQPLLGPNPGTKKTKPKVRGKRDKKARKAAVQEEEASPCCSSSCCDGNNPSAAAEKGTTAVTIEKPKAGRVLVSRLRVQALCCEMEVELSRKLLMPLPGVISVKGLPMSRVLLVQHDTSKAPPALLVEKLNEANLGASVQVSGKGTTLEQEAAFPMDQALSVALLLSLMVGGMFYDHAAAAYSGHSKQPHRVLGLEKNLFAILGSAFGLAMMAPRVWTAMRVRMVSVQVLMFIASLGAVVLGDFVEASQVVALFALSNLIVDETMRRVQNTLLAASVSTVLPPTCVLNTGKVIDVTAVVAGQVVCVRGGEYIPVDGIVAKGDGGVDESSLTGESIPLNKRKDSKVFAGTLLQSGYIEVTASGASNETSLAQVLDTVESMQASKSKQQMMIDRFAAVYTPLIILTAAATAFLMPLVSTRPMHEWVMAGCKVLVLGCPCSIVFANPLPASIFAGVAAKEKVLVKSVGVLEVMPHLSVMCFDKTGTLTDGNFAVTGKLDAKHPHFRWEDCQRLAASVESKTAHPIANAIVADTIGCVASAVAEQGVQGGLPSAANIKTIDGVGVSGTVDFNGVPVHVAVGSAALLAEYNISDKTRALVAPWKANHVSCLLVYVVVDGELGGCLALSDTVRPTSRRAIRQLNVADIDTVILSGDRMDRVKAVQEAVGTQLSAGGMTPASKLDWVRSRQSAGAVVGMVGDGVNDAPALRAADVSIAMGEGISLSVKAADVVLLTNDLGLVPPLYRFVRDTRNVIRQNIGAAVVIKAVAVAAAATGTINLSLAVLSDAAGLLIVLANSCRLFAAWKETA